MSNQVNNRRWTSRLLDGVCFVLLAMAFFTSQQAQALDHIEVRSVPDYNLGTWTGNGNLARSETFCVSSADTNSFLPFGRTMPYNAKVESLDGGNDFYLYLDGNAGNTGNRRIRIDMSHRDIYDATSYEQLNHNRYDNHNHNGSFRYCFFTGANSDLRVEARASSMSGKVSGIYSGIFRFSVRGGESGSAIDSATFRVSVVVQARTEVQISGLDNLSLGSHGGQGAIYAEENFCVYSTTPSGSYRLTVSSPNQDGGGNFHLDSTAGLGRIPYELYFVDAASGPGGTRVSNSPVGGQGDSSNQYCGGGNNATLSVNITEQDLQQAKSGNYRDTLTILVEPQ